MPFIPAPQVVQCELVFNYGGEVCENVLHYLSPVTPTIASMSLLGQQMVDWFSVEFKAQVPNTVQLINVKLTDLTTETGPVVNYAVSLPIVGTRPGAQLPNNCALVITKRTAKRGRSYRGRIYMVGLTETDVTGNTISSATLAGVLFDWELIRQPTTVDGDYPMVVISRYSNGAPRLVADIEVVISLTSDGVLDSQRRRLPGRGS